MQQTSPPAIGGFLLSESAVDGPDDFSSGEQR